jgi:hypothetical protein
MDVLEFWSPTIDWSRFAQGAVSDRMWRAFKDLVKLCHCVEHWREDHRALARTRSPKPLYPESVYMRKKRFDEWKQPQTISENHMHRAANLAIEKVGQMSHLAPTDEGNPDWKLCAAAVFSFGISLGQTHARYKSLALDAFDAAELSQSDPSVIASQWLANAGYTDEPRL